jgi:hypothetical protein
MQKLDLAQIEAIVAEIEKEKEAGQFPVNLLIQLAECLFQRWKRRGQD